MGGVAGSPALPSPADIDLSDEGEELPLSPPDPSVLGVDGLDQPISFIEASVSEHVFDASSDHRSCL